MDHEQWTQAIFSTYQQLLHHIVHIGPQLIKAALVFIVGILIASVIGRIVEQTVIWSERLIRRIGNNHHPSQPINAPLAGRARQVSFWLAVLFFLSVGLQIIEWPFLNKIMSEVIRYLPKIMVGLLIILVGFFIGNLAYHSVTYSKTNIAERAMLGRMLQIGMITIAVLVGIAQIDIQVRWLIYLMLLVIGILLAGFVLTFAFAAKATAANLLAMRHCKSLCVPGVFLKLNHYEGRVLELTATHVVLETSAGMLYVPAADLQAQVFALQEKANS